MFRSEPEGLERWLKCSIENQKAVNSDQWCSIENCKGLNTDQRCSIENQKGTLAIED